VEFINGKCFREKATEYLKKYARIDHVEASKRNKYVLKMNYSDRPLDLTEEEIQTLFPKAVSATFGPSQNGRSQHLSLIFKRPKHTNSAYKEARKIFGLEINLSYGEKE